ncbi:MAG: MATE family efflux transporter [Planctomycetaceae bacterium]|jgi:putative MATE family efflux protein|nr:MATE family efflux transporter [Planctomycetaceae bacterium]
MDHAERTRQLEKRPVGRLLWEFSVPAIAATVINASHSIINRIFVGQTIGEVGIAAVTVTLPMMTIMLAVGMTIGIGSNTLISIRLGEKKNEEAERIVGQALLLFGLMAIGFMVFGLLFQEPLLRLFGTTERVMPYAKEYLSVMVCGAFFHEISYGVNGFLRSEGKPRTAMMTTLIMAFLNIFFDWLFLCVLRTGIWGAAFATILAQICSTSWVFWHYISGNTLLRWRLKNIRWDFELSRQVFLLGMPPFIMQSIACVLQAIQMRQIFYYGNLYGMAHHIENGGDLAVGAFGIVFVVSMAVFLPILGLNQGVQPIVGYNIGARHFDRVAKTLRLALGSVITFTLICSIALFVFPEILLRPFAGLEGGTDLLKLGCRAARIFVLMLPAAGIVIVMAGYFQSNGTPKLAIAITLIRQVVLFVPLILILPHYFGLDGIWFAIPICDFGSFVFVAILLQRELKKLRQLIT